jgi:hypothetical protein
MSKIVQEKFQEEFPQKPEGIESRHWASDKSARVKKGLPGKEDVHTSSEGVMFNSLPPGMDIEDQEMADIRQQYTSDGGATDVSHDTPMGSDMNRGFKRKRMRPTDDLYTNEHVDLFYGEIKVEVEDGEMEVGFLERGNLLDRM